MGIRGDPLSVVATDLRVHGLKGECTAYFQAFLLSFFKLPLLTHSHPPIGIRIADSSVMPKIPGGQTGAPTVMIAEKAADIIIQSAFTVEKSVSEPALEIGVAGVEALAATDTVIRSA
jgi:GMC oxidoreductase